MSNRKKTKIVATLGPASDKVEVMEEMIGKSFNSDLEWADAWSLPKKQVKKLKSLVRESFKSSVALREAVSIHL